MKRIIFVAAFAGMMIAPCGLVAQAPAGATGQCKDGTYTTAASKQGACRGHKGVASWNADAAPAAKAQTVKTAPTSAPAAGPMAAAPKAATGSAGATGQCKDGSYTTAASKQGACRGHQGVAAWYADGASTAKPQAQQAAPAPQSTSAPAAAPKAATGSAGATGQCKDGSYTTAASKQGACRGHQGVATWYAAAATTAPAQATPAPATPASAAQAPQPIAQPAPAPVATRAAPAYTPPAPQAKPMPTPVGGGGPGLVWVNTPSNVYHCYGTRFYGTTKSGRYMTEADAKAAGARPDHNTPCSK